MKGVPQAEFLRRIRELNPWWKPQGAIPDQFARHGARPYLEAIYPLFLGERRPRRALVLVGPRRVGKTVLLHHAIRRAIGEGSERSGFVFLTIDDPLFSGEPLRRMLDLAAEAQDREALADGTVVVFDEIQYLDQWEQHLKVLVDSFPKLQFVASGSAAAALKAKSAESGAGRFTDFVLPPLSFYEFCYLLGDERACSLVDRRQAGLLYAGFAEDFGDLNQRFLEYLNFGGYPEVALIAEARGRMDQYVRQDIIDKVLYRDIPHLYGIQDVQKLNSLFGYLAYHTGKETSTRKISQETGLAKATVQKYLEYLEAAFLVQRVERVDAAGNRLQRETTYKVYLTNPSMYAALFSVVDEDSPATPFLVETAVMAQLARAAPHGPYYARWKKGRKDVEVDAVLVDADRSPMNLLEVKWSDRVVDTGKGDLAGLVETARRMDLKGAMFTTRSSVAAATRDGVALVGWPAAYYCLWLGHAVVQSDVGREIRLTAPAPDSP